MWTNPILSIAIYFLLYGIGSIISRKTKGIVIEALFLSIIYAIGFTTGLFPQDALNGTGIPAMMNAFGLMLIITNLGTSIELKRFVAEWRTVLICLIGLVVLGIMFFTLGSLLFGRYYALSAFPPISGGVVATSLVVSAAENAGMNSYGAFASLLCSLQSFGAVPIASVLMRKYCDNLVKEEKYIPVAQEKDAKSWPSLKLIKRFPEALCSGPMITTRLLLVCIAGTALANATGGVLPAAVMVLILGIIFTEIGFLEKQTLAQAGYMEFLMPCLIMLIPNGFTGLTLSQFSSILLPSVFFVVFGAISLAIGGVIAGKLLKVDWRLAASISLSAMYGYPLSEAIARSIVSQYDLPENAKENMLGLIMPQLIIAGFTTVTVASVVIAGFVVPLIFI